MRGSLFLNNTARIGFTEDGELDENAGKGGGIMSFADGDSLLREHDDLGQQGRGAPAAASSTTPTASSGSCT